MTLPPDNRSKRLSTEAPSTSVTHWDRNGPMACRDATDRPVRERCSTAEQTSSCIQFGRRPISPTPRTASREDIELESAGPWMSQRGLFSCASANAAFGCAIRTATTARFVAAMSRHRPTTSAPPQIRQVRGQRTAQARQQGARSLAAVSDRGYSFSLEPGPGRGQGLLCTTAHHAFGLIDQCSQRAAVAFGSPSRPSRP